MIEEGTLKKTILLLLSILGITTVLAQTPMLNEIQASNQNTIANSFGSYNDWVELYNPTDSAIDLTGYYISDRVNNPQKWQIPSGAIASHGRILIWASDRDLVTAEGELHTNFKISNGETVVLSSPSGNIINQITLPELMQDESFGRLSDGAIDWAYFTTPTPFLPNETQTGFQEFLEQPTVNHESGFYNNPIQLSLSTTEPDALIYYTLDCSEPIPGSPNTYQFNNSDFISIDDISSNPNDISMIRTTLDDSGSWIYNWNPPTELISKATIVRTKVVKPGAMASKTLSLTYFIGSEIQAQYQDIPVISLVTSRDNFFGNTTGIYIPGTDENGEPNTTSATANYSQDWERPIHLQLWEPNRTDGFATNAIAQIHGSASANLMRKGLRIEFGSNIGVTELNYDLFDTGSDESFESFLVRASGQDVQQTLFRDAFGQTLFKEQDLSTAPYRTVVLFINGEYWGLHNLRERSREDYISRIHDVDTDEMDFLETRGASHPSEIEGTEDYYMSLLNFVQDNDLSIQENYDVLSQMMDIENYIKYYIAETFIANSDWPSYNVRMWRYKPELFTPNQFYDDTPDEAVEDGRFRWVLFDLDQALGRFHNYTANTIQSASSIGTWNDNFFLLFRKLIGASDANGNLLADGPYNTGSPQFRNMFINYYCDAMNSYLSPTTTVGKLDSVESDFAPYMPEHIARWTYPETTEEWNADVNGVRAFLNNRPASIITQLTNKFNLNSGTANLTLSINQSSFGSVLLNSLELGNNESSIPTPFTGEYFQDIPVTIKAIPNPGYIFSGWNGIDAESDSIIVNLTSDIELTALFEEYNAIDDETAPSLSNSISLSHYPNPVFLSNTNSGVSIDFSLPKHSSEKPRLEIFNIKGQKVKEIEISETKIHYSKAWDCRDASSKSVTSGIYFYRVSSGNDTATGRMMVIR